MHEVQRSILFAVLLADLEEHSQSVEAAAEGEQAMKQLVAPVELQLAYSFLARLNQGMHRSMLEHWMTDWRRSASALDLYRQEQEMTILRTIWASKHHRQIRSQLAE